jgi:hypothetical protein
MLTALLIPGHCIEFQTMKTLAYLSSIDLKMLKNDNVNAYMKQHCFHEHRAVFPILELALLKLGREMTIVPEFQG